MCCYNLKKLVITSCNTLRDNSLFPLKTSNLEKNDGFFKCFSKAANDVEKGQPSFEDLYSRYPETSGYETHDRSKNSKSVISIIVDDVDGGSPSEVLDLKDTDVSDLKSFNQNQLSVSMRTNCIGDSTSSLRNLDLDETNGPGPKAYHYDKTSRILPPDLVYEPDYYRSPQENQSYIDSVSNANESIINCSLPSKGLKLEKVNNFGNEILSQSQNTSGFVPGTKACSGENSSQISCNMHLEDTDCCGKKSIITVKVHGILCLRLLMTLKGIVTIYPQVVVIIIKKQ